MFAGDKKKGGVLHGQYIPSFLLRTSSHPTPLLQQGVETANHISSINCLDKTPNLPKLTSTINSQTHQPTNSSTHKLTNSIKSQTHQLINSSTHQLTNSQTHQLKILKILSFILQRRSFSRSVLAKTQAIK